MGMEASAHSPKAPPATMIPNSHGPGHAAVAAKPANKTNWPATNRRETWLGRVAEPAEATADGRVSMAVNLPDAGRL